MVVASGGSAAWDPETGEEKVRFAEPLGRVLGFAAKDRLLDPRPDSVRVIDPATGKSREPLPWRGERPRNMAVAPDGTAVAVATGPNVNANTTAIPGADCTVRVIDPATGKELVRLTGHESTVIGVAYSRDGTRIATTGLDRTVRVWDAKTGKEVAVFRGHTGAGQGVAFLPDGRTVLSAAFDGTVRSWRLPGPPR